MNPDYTRCEHRFYFKDKEEWSSWSESFEPGSITMEIESEIAEAEVRNVQPLFTPEKIKKLVHRTHGKLVGELNDMSEEEDTDMGTLAQELIDEIEDLDDKTGGEASEQD